MGNWYYGVAKNRESTTRMTPSWQGYSTATWQGDTLVITSKLLITLAFADDP